MSLARRLAACALVLAAGCAPTPSFSPPTFAPAPAPTPAAQIALPSGPTTIRLDSGREYVLLNPGGGVSPTRRPLLIVLHSYQSSWQRLDAAARITERARAEGFVVAFAVGERQSWNAGGCCGWARDHRVDDVDYLVRVAEDVRRRTPIDDVDLLGFSAGDMMALRALCERPDVFAAAAGAAGNLVSTCRSGRALRYLHLHGSADTTVPLAGGRVGWLGVTFAPIAQLPARIESGAPGSTVELVTHRCGHVWPTFAACGTDGLGVALRFYDR